MEQSRYDKDGLCNMYFKPARILKDVLNQKYRERYLDLSSILVVQHNWPHPLLDQQHIPLRKPGHAFVT